MLSLGLGLWRAALSGGGVPVVKLVLLTGESNSGGYALNSDPSAGELAARSVVQILNNTTLEWADLDVGTNNLIGHSGLTDNATHGLEIGLANTVDAIRWDASQIYLVKAGQGGSTIAQWADGHGSGYLDTLRDRLNAAKSLFATAEVNYTPLVVISLGINDAIAATDVATWKAAVIAWIADIRAELTATTRVYLTKFEGADMTARTTFNTAMDEIAASDAYAFTVGSSGLTVRDANHWDYLGFLGLAENIVDQINGASGTLATPTVNISGGEYDEDQTVTISGPSGATIRYTTDGETPTSHSTAYSTPVTVSLGSTLKAVAFKLGWKNSAVMSEQYTAPVSEWVTWSDLQNASQPGDYLVSNGSAPGGGIATTTIDATAAFRVVIDMPSNAAMEGNVVWLDADNTQEFDFGTSGVYLAGTYDYINDLYSSVLGGTATNEGALSFPSLVSLLKSGDDVLLQVSTDDGDNWTTRHTFTGALTGQTTLYLKSLFAIPLVSKQIRARIE